MTEPHKLLREIVEKLVHHGKHCFSVNGMGKMPVAAILVLHEFDPKMYLRSVYLFLALFSFCSGLSAAGFDCHKARQASEKLICSDPELSAIDSQMAETYSHNFSELHESAQAHLRGGQREWLAYWPKICANDPGGALKKSKDTIDCAKREYKERLAILKRQSRILKSLVIYPISQYKVTQSTAGLDFIKIAHHMENRLAIDVDAASPEDRPLAEAINQWLVESGAGPKEPTSEITDERTNDTEVELTLVPQSSSLILAVSKATYLFGHGAAHPLSTTSQCHFNLSSRKPLSVEDVFLGSDWKPSLAHLVEEALKKEYKDDYAVDKFETLVEMVSQSQYWIIRPEGLVLQFNPYDVAPYAAGAPSVTIPWAALKPWINPAFLASVSEKQGSNGNVGS